MKNQKIIITINKSVEKVFDFITNPINTPKWIHAIVKEEADSDLMVGTIIRNWDTEGNMNEYKVTAYEYPNLFQLESTVADYKLRYTCTSLSETETIFEYYEWSESGYLHSSSMQEILDELKKVMEKL